MFSVIRDDFREEPDDKTVALDARAVLGCRGPRGEPEPTVSWLHNGKPLGTDSRVHVLEEGGLEKQ